MNETEETLKQTPDTKAILQAIAELTIKFDTLVVKFDTLEKNSNAQFEVIREGIAYNSVKFDRLTAEVY